MRTVELKYIILGFVLFIVTLGGHHIYYEQNFICDKTKDICYSTIFGIKSTNEIKISNLNGIKITQDTKRNHKGKGHTVTVDVYMPTLITEQGGQVPFYNAPTMSVQKAQQDKDNFTNFLRSSTNNLNLKNTENFIWLF